MPQTYRDRSLAWQLVPERRPFFARRALPGQLNPVSLKLQDSLSQRGRERPVTPPKAARQRSPTPSRRRRRTKRREPRTAAVEEPKATAPAGSDKAPIAQQDSTGSHSEAAMFDLVLRSNRNELRQQLQSIIGNLDATDFQRWAYSPVGVHDVCAALCRESFDHCQFAQLADHLPCSRQAFTAAVARPWGEIPGTETADVVQFLISRFPRPPRLCW